MPVPIMSREKKDDNQILYLEYTNVFYVNLYSEIYFLKMVMGTASTHLCSETNMKESNKIIL